MACFRPLRAFKTAGGEVVFAERGDIVRALFLPCGQCVGCRLERSRQWAVRCMHEASLCKFNCFVTLTYNDEHLPKDGSLRYEDFQLFMKRLRRKIAPVKVRFYMCGEYGEGNWRPHFHACLFGIDFADKKPWSTTGSGSKLYRSATLEALWPYGFSSIGQVNFESAAYVARYVMKKVNGPCADEHYRRVDTESGEVTWLTPEFTFMSLKPGIGALWYDRYCTEVYPHDRVIVRGRKCKPPKYYDLLHAEKCPDEFEALKFQRELEALGMYADNTDERLAVREVVVDARVNMFSRKLGG